LVFAPAMVKLSTKLVAILGRQRENRIGAPHQHARDPPFTRMLERICLMLHGDNGNTVPPCVQCTRKNGLHAVENDGIRPLSGNGSHQGWPIEPGSTRPSVYKVMLDP